MRLCARAPGKVVVLGEYAVLEGAPALVLAIDRAARVELETRECGLCRLTTLAPLAETREFVPGTASGVALVDLVLAADREAARRPPWQVTLDSRALFLDGAKLGVGSSAAALCAFAGAYARYQTSLGAPVTVAPRLEVLVGLHRTFQGGRGSGLDIAASLTGGLIRYELDTAGRARVGLVELPIGVGFAGIFTGKSASTPDFLARFDAWRQRAPERARAMIARLAECSTDGIAAAATGDLGALLEAVGRYGGELDALGEAIGAEIVTPEHRAIEREARSRGIAYKVSGAGGGDVGLAMSADPATLRAFKAVVAEQGYRVVDLVPDRRGLVVEEQRA